MGQMIDIRDLDGVVMDMVDPMASGSLFRRVQQRNQNMRDLYAERQQETLNDLARDVYTQNMVGYHPNSIDSARGSSSPVFDANAYNSALASNAMEGYTTNAPGYETNPIDANRSTGVGYGAEEAPAVEENTTDTTNPTDKGGVGEETNAEPKTDLYRVIQSELQSLDDGMSLTGAERMVQAFDQIFAKYENADAEIANMFLGKNNVRKETAYSPFLGR